MNENEDVNWVRFHDLIVNLRLSLSNELQEECQSFISKFNTTQSNRDRIAFCLEREDVNRSVEIVKKEIFKKLSNCCKNDEKSKELRLCGNEFFKKGDFLNAASFYTRALINASFPDNKLKDGNGASEICSCFGNRSAALFHLQRYSQAIADIDEALKYCDCNSKKKLLSRKIECLINIKKVSKAKHLLESISDILCESYASIKKRLESLAEVDDEDCCVIPEKSKNENCCISGAVDGLEVKVSEKKGRHITTTKNFGIREVLVTEKPYSWFLEDRLFLEHCQHCLKKLEFSGIPCINCNEVMFCSNTCKDLSRVYHEKECCYCLPAINSLGISYLVLRTIFTAELESIVKAVDLKNDNSIQLEAIFESNYHAVYNLGNHENDFAPEEYLNFTLAALFLLSIYENVLDKKITLETRFKLACAILHHIQQLNTNAITIFAQKISRNFLKSEFNVDESRLGIGLYPIISLFNHSCLPNTVAFYTGSQITIETSKNIRNNEEIYFCYGPAVGSMSLKDRQKALKSQYFFDCDCLGCTGRIENRRRAFLCPKCKGALIINDDLTNECIDCKETDFDVTDLMNQVEESRQLAEEGKQLLSEEDFDEAVIKLSFSNKIKEKCCFRLNDELKDVKNDICTCVAMLQHFDVAFQYCKQVLAITTDVYGEQSLEVAQVMVKMVSLKLRAVEDLREDNEEKATIEARNFMPFIDSTISKFQRFCSISSKNKDDSLFASEIEYLNKNRQILNSYC